jgi:hypothetical protein
MSEPHPTIGQGPATKGAADQGRQRAALGKHESGWRGATDGESHLASAFFGGWLKHSPRCNPLTLLRTYSRWKDSLLRVANTLELRLPWINFPAIDLLAGSLRPGARVFEYGCGGSTLFFLDRGLQVVSVEHEEVWLRRISELVAAGGAGSAEWRGLLRPPLLRNDRPSPQELADVGSYRSASRRFALFSFEDYARAIDDFPDAHFDLVLVDGRARPSCVRHAARKVRPEGLLLLDNTERPYYLERTPDCLPGWRKALDCFGPTPTQRQFTRCTVWQRPR